MRKIPGVEMSSGSLGQGLSVALGMSLGARLTGRNYKVYVMLSDAEMQSGQVWEALMACSHYRTNNLTAILDYNKLQVNDFVDKVMNIEPLANKIDAFGWNISEIDGHSLPQVVEALKKGKNNRSPFPTFIIAHTTKGKGIPFIEGNVDWHACSFSEQDYQRAKQALATSDKELLK
jgi:transketolase